MTMISVHSRPQLLLRLFLCLFMFCVVWSYSASITHAMPQCRSVPVPQGFSAEFKHVMLSQVGVREVGKNRGAQVDAYNRSTGTALGSPYCWSGLHWSADSAAKRLNVTHPFAWTGLASRGRRMFDKISIPLRHPPSGGISGVLFWQFPHNSFGHADGVVAVLDGGWLRCVSFNSGGLNPRDGGGVRLMRRNPMHPLAAMRCRGLYVLKDKR